MSIPYALWVALDTLMVCIAACLVVFGEVIFLKLSVRNSFFLMTMQESALWAQIVLIYVHGTDQEISSENLIPGLAHLVAVVTCGATC